MSGDEKKKYREGSYKGDDGKIYCGCYIYKIPSNHAHAKRTYEQMNDCIICGAKY